MKIAPMNCLLRKCAQEILGDMKFSESVTSAIHAEAENESFQLKGTMLCY